MPAQDVLGFMIQVRFGGIAVVISPSLFLGPGGKLFRLPKLLRVGDMPQQRDIQFFTGGKELCEIGPVHRSSQAFSLRWLGSQEFYSVCAQPPEERMG